jgi:hypothetical protein
MRINENEGTLTATEMIEDIRHAILDTIFPNLDRAIKLEVLKAGSLSIHISGPATNMLLRSLRDDLDIPTNDEEREAFLDRPLTDAKDSLPTRFVNTLNKHGYRTNRDLITLSKERLLAIPNISLMAKQYIENYLTYHGFTLAQ